MCNDEKGQSVLVDLLVSVMIFMTIFFLLLSAVSMNLGVVEKEESFNDIRQRAFQATEMLLRGSGSPKNWDRNILDVDRIGLVVRDRVIDLDKLNAFQQLELADYNNVKTLLLIANYDFLFELGSGFIVGESVPGNADVVVVRRVVDYNGGDTVVEFTLFRAQ